MTELSSLLWLVGLVFFTVVALPEALSPLPKVVSQSNSQLIGGTGETISTIFSEGMVVIGDETWPAVSKHPIPPGKPVRVARVVLEVEALESGFTGSKA